MEMHKNGGTSTIPREIFISCPLLASITYFYMPTLRLWISVENVSSSKLRGITCKAPGLISGGCNIRPLSWQRIIMFGLDFNELYNNPIILVTIHFIHILAENLENA